MNTSVFHGTIYGELLTERLDVADGVLECWGRIRPETPQLLIRTLGVGKRVVTPVSPKLSGTGHVFGEREVVNCR